MNADFCGSVLQDISALEYIFTGSKFQATGYYPWVSEDDKKQIIKLFIE